MIKASSMMKPTIIASELVESWEPIPSFRWYANRAETVIVWKIETLVALKKARYKHIN